MTDQDEAALEQEYDHWQLLPDYLRQRLWGLSADLYSLTGEEVRLDSGEFANDRDRMDALRGAFSSKQWDRCLFVLRDGKQPMFDEGALANLRGKIWSAMDRYDVALLFLRRAVAVDQRKKAYLVDEMSATLLTGDWDLIVERLRPLLRSEDPISAMRAAVMLRVEATRQGRELEVAEEILRTLNATLSSRDQALREDRELYFNALASRAKLLDARGESQLAIRDFDQMEIDFPNSVMPFVGRGELRFRLNDSQWEADADEAIKREVPLVWPYFEKSRRLIALGKAEEAERMLQLGVARCNRRSDAYGFLFAGLAYLSSRSGNVANARTYLVDAKSWRPFEASFEKAAAELDGTGAIRDFPNGNAFEEFATLPKSLAAA